MLACRFGFPVEGSRYKPACAFRAPENRIVVLPPSIGHGGKMGARTAGGASARFSLRQAGPDGPVVASSLPGERPGIPPRLNCYNPWYQTGQRFPLLPELRAAWQGRSDDASVLREHKPAP